MSLHLDPIHPVFAARASGVDLSRPLDRPTIDEINAAMDRYAVLVFHDQPLSQARQAALAESFGPLDMGLKSLKKQADRMEHPALIDISNVSAEGGVAERGHRKIVSNIANQLWHTDSSFQKPCARYSMLSAVTLPSWGGDTQFADMRAAYDALPETLKQELEGLEAEHYALHSRFLLGDTDYSETQRNAKPPVWWPVVRRHAGSGRRHLYIGAHAQQVRGWPLAEGRMLLWDLLEHATRERFVYTHRWRVGDLVIWDNRCTLHRGRRFDLSEHRELRRATTLDQETGAA